LGVVPSAWSGTGPGQKVLQLQAFAISSDVNTSYHTNNAVYTAGSNWFYAASKAALKVEYDASLGQFRWYSAPSGTAGAAIPFTQAMSLDSSSLILGSGPARGNMDISSSATSSVVTMSLHLGYSPADFYGSRIVNSNNPTVTSAGLFKIQQGTTAAWRDDLIIDNSGNLLVGTAVVGAPATGFTASPSGSFQVAHPSGAAAGSVYSYFLYNATVLGSITQLGTTGISLNSSASLGFNNGAMTIDTSGNLLVGTASSGIKITQSIGYGYLDTYHPAGAASGTVFAQYVYNGSPIGSITQSGTTAVLYNTTSDYRLKANQQPLTGSGAFIDALKPTSWEWTADGRKDAGFIAHEFQEVVPNSVTGVKDGTEEREYEVSPAVAATQDAEGVELTPATPAVMGTRTVPKYQAMQASSAEVIANLVAELQSLRKRVAQLENK